MIQRKKVSEVDITEIDDAPTYCQKCHAVGIVSPLQPRLYGQGVPIPSDDDNWRQCYRCGKLVEIYNVKHESDKLRGFTEPNEDPFDFGQKQADGLKSRRSLMKDFKRKDDYDDGKYDDIPDVDIRSQLRHGAILLDYSESNV